jgi:hypothetical protein
LAPPPPPELNVVAEATLDWALSPDELYALTLKYLVVFGDKSKIDAPLVVTDPDIF